MAERVPPVLPPAGDVGAPSDWEQKFGQILHGFNPGGVFSGGPPAGNAPAGQGATVEPSQADPAVQAGIKAAQSVTGGGPLSADFWHRLLLDVEVYGFLFLLVGIGLYGLFAPQVTVAVQKAAKAAL